MADHLLPLADIEVSKRVERIFKSKKIKFYTSNGVEKIENQNVTLKSGETLTPELVLLATGRTPQPIENCDICIGDACGKIQLAHFAIKQAVAEIANIEFNETSFHQLFTVAQKLHGLAKENRIWKKGITKNQTF